MIITIEFEYLQKKVRFLNETAHTFKRSTSSSDTGTTAQGYNQASQNSTLPRSISSNNKINFFVEGHFIVRVAQKVLQHNLMYYSTYSTRLEMGKKMV